MKIIAFLCKITFCFWGFASVLQAQNLAFAPQYDAKVNVQKIERLSPKAATMKVILVICDNYISAENNGIAQSVRVDMGTMTQLFNVLEKRNIIKVEKTVLQGTKATIDNIRAAMKNLQVGTDDVIMFYFSGHGGMQNGKTFLFTADEKELQRSEIEAVFNSKPARLKMIITDACSNDVDGLSATRSLSKSGQQIDAGEFDAIYKELFLNHQGMLHLSASSEGEYAWSNDNFGGFFTYHFVKEGLIKKPVGDWQTIFTGAKDKTSQMFMRMPSEQRAQLAKEGIKNQTAKAFAMPKAKTGNGNLANNTTNNLPNNNTTNNLPNNNTNNNNNNNNNQQTNNNNLPNNNTNTNNNNTNNNTNNGGGGGGLINNLQNKKGTIVIDNYTDEVVNFYIDNNKSNSIVWDKGKVKNMSVAAGKSVSINQGYAVLGFNSDGAETYYEIEEGNYFFATDESSVLDLFYKEKNITAENHHTVAQTDYAQLLLGKWEWEDMATEEIVVTTFRRDNTFTDQYPNEASGGTWQVQREKVDEKDYTIITFTLKQDNGSDLEIDYIVTIEEEYPNEVQLVFVAAYENGEEIPYEEAEEYFETNIFMTKVK
ncbi:MAG: caspase family protein [Cytophagales bacterium]|nr:MAG: caspase family protein [Cytophagales bacterium]